MKMNITMDPKNKKRRADRTFYNDSDSDYEIRTKTMNWPRFLLVESGDDSLPVTKLSPFAIDKGFQALISGPHGLAFTQRGCFSTKLAHSFLSHLCLSFCLPESFTCTSFHPSTSPDISAVFQLGLSFLSTPAFHLYFSFVQAFFLPLLFFSVVH